MIPAQQKLHVNTGFVQPCRAIALQPTAHVHSDAPQFSPESHLLYRWAKSRLKPLHSSVIIAHCIHSSVCTAAYEHNACSMALCCRLGMGGCHYP